MYDPVLGRFISADPFVPGRYNLQALNRYSYVLNDPLTYTNPTGYDPLDEAKYMLDLDYWTQEQYDEFKSLYNMGLDALYLGGYGPFEYYMNYGMTDAATAHYMWEYQVGAQLEGLFNEGIASGSVTYTLPDPSQCVQNGIISAIDRADNGAGILLKAFGAIVGKPHGNSVYNYRERKLINSLQVNIDISDPHNVRVQVDVDFGNPAYLGVGSLLHAGQVLINKAGNTDNKYGCRY